MKIPKKVKVGGHVLDVIETDDIKKLESNSYGIWDSMQLKIHIRKSMPQSQKEQVFLHETGEVLLRSILNIVKEDFSHQDWSRFSEGLYQLLKDNHLNFGG